MVSLKEILKGKNVLVGKKDSLASGYKIPDGNSLGTLAGNFISPFIRELVKKKDSTDNCGFVKMKVLMGLPT